MKAGLLAVRIYAWRLFGLFGLGEGGDGLTLQHEYQRGVVGGLDLYE